MSGQPLLSRFFRPVGKAAAADRPPASAHAPVRTHAHTHTSIAAAPHVPHGAHATPGHDTVDLTLDDEIPTSPATPTPTARHAPPPAASHPSSVHFPSTLTHTHAAGTHSRIHGQRRVAASAGPALANERAAIVAALSDDVPEAVSAYQEQDYLLLGAAAGADMVCVDAQPRVQGGASRDTSTQARGGRAGGKRCVAAEAGPALTALEKQVLELKSQCPHAVLLVQAGYKYRCFGRDASVLSRVAHVWAYKPRARVLTTASIPTHRIGVHVRRLVASGYAAAVAAQSEGAASKAAGMGVAARYRTFARHIARVYTPATTDDDALIGESAVERSRDGVGADDAEMAVVVQAAADVNVQSCVCICRPMLRKATVYTWSHAASTVHDDFQAIWQRILRQHSVREVLVPATAAERGKRDLLASVAPPIWERLRSAASEVCSTGSYILAAANSVVPARVALDDRKTNDTPARAARFDDVVADDHAPARACCTRLQLRLPAELLTTGEELLASRDEPAASPTNDEEAADEEDEDDGMEEPSAEIDPDSEAAGVRKRGRVATVPGAADSTVPDAIEPSDSAVGVAAAYRLEVIATSDGDVGHAGEAAGDVPSLLLRRALSAAKTYERALRSPQSAMAAQRAQAANEPPANDAPYSVTAGRIIGANDAGSNADRMLLDDITLEDLQVLRALDSGSEGSLLHVLHQGGGPMGRRVLHDWLAYPLKRREAIMERQQGVTALAAAINGANVDGCPCAPCAALAMQAYKDHGRADIDAWLQRIAAGGATPQHVVRLLDVLAAVADAVRSAGGDVMRAATARSCAAGRIVHEYAQTLMTGGAPRALQAELENSLDIDMVRRGMHKGRSAAATSREPALPGGVPSSIPFRVESPHVRASFPQIGRWWDALQAANTALESELEHARALLRKPGLEWTTHRTGPTSVTECLVELRRAELESPLAPLHVPEDWVEINATKAVRRYHTPGAQRGLETRALAREMLAGAADAAWKTWCERLIARCGPDLSDFAHAIGQLDALACLARVATLPGWVAPTLVSDGQPYVHIRAGRHPMVEAAMQLRGSGPYVPSDMELSSSVGRVMVLTGPNAGGKSTTVRMAALCVLLAHVGSFVPADSAELSTFDVIATRMGASDAIVQGRSTFRVEMDETARILSAIEACRAGRVLAVFDELGRGTATFDGCALALATLKHVLLRCPHVAGVFITHYPQLNHAHELVSAGSVGGAQPSLQYMHMAFVEEPISEPKRGTADEGATEEGETRLTLLYHLKSGPAPKSYGLRVAALAGMPASVLRVAHAVVAEFAHRPTPASLV